MNELQLLRQVVADLQQRVAALEARETPARLAPLVPIEVPAPILMDPLRPWEITC